MSGAGCNRLVIAGQLVELDTLRYTPAGVARLEMKIRHVSTQVEAGTERQVQCEITALALGEAARQAAPLQTGQQVKVQGFLAQRSMRSTQLVLHIEKIKLE
ncbi:MAG TPA: primosomal replication protein N [Gallionellaceae bacterium]|nr:primosomal replication protein N [Gallionellaceae bacterium]